MNKQNLVKYLKDNQDIIFALLFGSYAKGKANDMSDVDVAVYLSHDIRKSSYFGLRLGLIADCPVKGDKDVVILNESSPLLAYEVVSHCVPLFVRDKKIFIDFKAKTFGRYFDTNSLRRVQYAAMSKRIKEGTIGDFKRNNFIKVAKVRDFSRKIKGTFAAH